MAHINLKIHPAADIRWGKISELAGDTVAITVPGGDNGGEPVEPMALAMIEPDEINVYVFSDQGREALLRQMTGGVILP